MSMYFLIKQPLFNFTRIIIFLLPFYTFNSNAQSIAGNVYPGTSVQYPNIFIADSTTDIPVSDSLDLDCDNVKDLAIDLDKGNTIVDEPHTIWLRNISNTIELWRDSIYQHENMVPFYQTGDTMCNDGFQWMADSTTRFACGSGFCWDGIHEATDVYFAFRSISTQQIGWVKISFDLLWIDPVTFSISEVLVLCTGNGIQENDNSPFFTVVPNPSADGKVKLFSEKKIFSIEIRNAFGQIVKSFEGEQTEIILPEKTGIYFITAMDEDGRIQSGRVYRN